MSRAPKNPELHELANRLSRLTYLGPAIATAPSCQRHNGHIRVTRVICGRTETLGVTHDMGAAAFYSDCLTTLLLPYTTDSNTQVPEDVFNFRQDDYLLRDNPEIIRLADSVVDYLAHNRYLRDIVSLINSRRMTKIILADFDTQVIEAQRALAKSQAERLKTAEALAELYKL